MQEKPNKFSFKTNTNANVQQIPVFPSPQQPLVSPVNIQQQGIFSNQYGYAPMQQQYQAPQQIPNVQPNFSLPQQPQQPQQYQQFQQQPFSFPQQSYGNNYQQMIVQPAAHNLGGLRLLKAKDNLKKTVAIIISFCGGSTYDNLFTSVQQKTLEGTQVLVYQAQSTAIKEIYDGFTEKPTTDVAKELINNMKEVDPDCVVFNWQCSSNYDGQCFPEGKDLLMNFLKFILDAGHMAMFSDFSLKALIQQWDQSKLGSNPFVKTGETSQAVVLNFKSAVLKECPSAQLQIVGQMAQGGKCNIHTLGGTILYSVDPSKIDHNAYKLQILTVNTTNVPQNEQHRLAIDGHQGSAGHVLLTFKNKGQILTSMGHWIQLMKIDTSQHKLFEVAQREYGKMYAAQMRVQYAQMEVSQQKAWVQTQAVNFVQNQAPCSNMNKKSY